MGILSQRIIAKVSGPAWESLRGQFMRIARSLLAVSPDADSELVTTYVKFTVNMAPQSHVVQAQPLFGEQHVFAAIWLRSSKQLIVGLALPEEYEAADLGPACLGRCTRALRNTLWSSETVQCQRALQNGRSWRIRMPWQACNLQQDGLRDLMRKINPPQALTWRGLS